MKHWRVFVLGVACFVLGAVVQSGFAQKKDSKKPAFSPDQLKGDAKAVAAVMLDGALQLAENGTWERIAVGRASVPRRRQGEGAADLRWSHQRQERGTQ